MDTNILGTIFGVLSDTLRIYSFLLLIRVLLTWFPSIDWNKFVRILGYKFWDESQNDTYKLFLGASE